MRNWKDSLEWFYAAEYLTNGGAVKSGQTFLGDVITPALAHGGYQTKSRQDVEAYSVPVDVHVEMMSGDSYIKRSKHDEGNWVADFDLKSRLRRIVINPNEEIYTV